MAKGKTRLNVDITHELKMELKVHCAKNKINMTDVVVELIQEYLDNRRKEEKGAG